MRPIKPSSVPWGLVLTSITPVCGYDNVDYSQFVNPFIGGSGPYEGQAFGGGNIFVGGARPFGVAKVGIDTYEPNITYSAINGGWTINGSVTGVSMMHESGTGGAPKYGVVSQMPLLEIDDEVNLLDNTTYWQNRVGEDVANVGYFKTSLQNGIDIELSGGRHSGIMQYTFPEKTQGRHVLVDVSHYLPNEGGGYNTQSFLGGEISLQGSEYMGYGTYSGGFNEGAPYTVFFCGEFDERPEEARVFRGQNTDPNPRFRSIDNEPIPEPNFSSGRSVKSGLLNERIGAIFTWDNPRENVVKSKVGISFMDVETACRYRDREIRSWELRDTVDDTVMEWNKDVLSKVQVPTEGESVNVTNVILLYSSLYLTHLMPSDRTGENPLWESDEPYWDDFYTFWDIFRCTVSLYHILQPSRYESMIRAVIDVWRHEGYMPDGRSGNYNGLTQGGSNADNVLADAYVKGLRGDINWTDGYKAMVKDAEVVPSNTFSVLDETSSVRHGRGALPDWLELGYLSVDHFARSISRTIEYAQNDYSLSVVAAGESDDPGEEAKYLNRSANWQHLWSDDVEARGFTGFLAPRLSDGSFNLTEYNPARCGGCTWDSITYEATPFEYSFTVPHDMETLITRMGGGESFEERLDYIMIPGTSEQDLWANGAGITTIMNIGNEPDFAHPYLYNYINKQHKSVNNTRVLANQYFKNDYYGVPGNSDAGALNSWLIWSMLGIYPIATQPVWLVGSPWFSSINVTVNGNNTLRITSEGADDPRRLGQEDFYVQRVSINGEEWDKNWFDHEDIMTNGGSIEFVVGSNNPRWETGEVPPSPGHLDLQA